MSGAGTPAVAVAVGPGEVTALETVAFAVGPPPDKPGLEGGAAALGSPVSTTAPTPLIFPHGCRTSRAVVATATTATKTREAISQPRPAIGGFDVDAADAGEYGEGGGGPDNYAVGGYGLPTDRFCGSFNKPTVGPDRSTASVRSVGIGLSAWSENAPAISAPQSTQNRLNWSIEPHLVHEAMPDHPYTLMMTTEVSTGSTQPH